MTYKFENKPDNRPEKSQCHQDSPQNVEPYIAPDELIDAVNLAIFLRRPLLLEGEAGCGKTRLALAVAYELGLPFYRWDIRSTTKAQEGLYEYDAILRLHDVQTKEFAKDNPNQKLDRDPSNPKDYRTFGAIGKAFQADKPAVVLIDEIDKADIDFPNDLLTVLDEPWKFEIRETGETGDKAITAKHKPIVIISSNKEKGNLPAPFLRRCIYYYVKFPSSSQELEKIVNIHYQYKQEQENQQKITSVNSKPQKNQQQKITSANSKPDDELIKQAANLFLKIREDKGLFKIPGTSEFLDWLYALHLFQQTKQNSKPPYSVKELQEGKPIPYRELIFKIRQDWEKNTSFPQTNP